MATKSPTQKAKLTLRAIELSITDVTNDYYVRPKLQKCLTINDIAEEVSALSPRQEDPDDIARTGNDVFDRIMWYLSSGYSVTTKMGTFRPTAKGVFYENELSSAPDRSRIQLGVGYTMSSEMRQALNDAELDVELLKSVSGPQISGIVSAYDYENVEAAARGEGVPITPGEPCILRGKSLKVGGEGENIGVTITRMDGNSGETHFFGVRQLYTNKSTRVGFTLPATIENGSVWSVTLCTQLGSNGSVLLKEPRTVTMSDYFVVGEVPSDTDEDEGDAPTP